MKRLHSYVIKSFIGPFIMTFFIVSFVLLMQFLWRYIDDLVGKGLDFEVLAEMMFYASFYMLPLAFPLAMLLASIMTFGSFGENYELVAMKASGISLFRIMKPLIVIALLITLVAFYFSNNILPKTNMRLSSLMASVKRQKPEMILQPGVFTNEMDGYSIKVGRKNQGNKMLYDWLIYKHTKGRTNESVTVADSGYLKITEDKKYMVLTLFNGINYQEEKAKDRKKNNYAYRKDIFGKQTIRVKVRGFDFNRRDKSFFRNQYRMLGIRKLKVSSDSLSSVYLSHLRNYIVRFRLNSTINQRLHNLVVPDSLRRELHVPVADSTFDFDACFAGFDKSIKADIVESALQRARDVSQNVNIHQGQLYNRKKRLNRYLMEYHRKFTLSVAVLVFFFIGAPLGAIIRKGGLGMPVVVSIVLFIFYYIISMSGEKSAREDVWSMFNGMWFSTYLFLPAGIWLTYKAVTDSSIMSAETYSRFFKRFNFLKIFRKKKTGN